MDLALLIVIAAAGGDAPKRIAVLDVQAKGQVQHASVEVFAEMLQDSLRKRGFAVTGRSDIEAVLGLEKMKDALGCSSTTCLAEIGGALGVEELLTGVVAKVGSYLVITVKRVDPRRGEVKKQATRKIKQGTDDALVEAVEPLVDELYGPARPEAGADVAAKPDTGPNATAKPGSNPPADTGAKPGTNPPADAAKPSKASLSWSCANAPATYTGGLGAGNGGSGIYPGGLPLVGDVDGDGKADLLQYTNVWTSLPLCRGGTGWRCSNIPATGVGPYLGNGGSGIFQTGIPLLADVNGDHRADVVQYNAAWMSLPTCLSVQDGWRCTNTPAPGTRWPGTGGSGIYQGGIPLVGDVNGDHKDDILQYNSAWQSIPVCLAVDGGWRCDNVPATFEGDWPGNGGTGIYPGGIPLVGDVDGDGRADLVQYNAAWSSIPVCLAVDSGWRCRNIPATYVGGIGAGNNGTGIYPGGTPLLADVDHDGKLDLVQYNSGWQSIPVCLAGPGAWRCSNITATYVDGIGAGNGGSAIYPGGIPLLGDVDGDGRADLVQYGATWSSIPVCLSNNGAWRCSNAPAVFTGGLGAGNFGTGVYLGGAPLLADVDGDHRMEVLQYQSAWASIPVCTLSR